MKQGPSEFVAYLDPTRKVGSQSEVPFVYVEGESLHVSGYQNFHVDHKGIDHRGLAPKFLAIKRLIDSLPIFQDSKHTSLLDIGSSSGLLGFLAQGSGYSPVVCVDHDPEYVDVINRVARQFGWDVDGRVGGWNSQRGSYDVVCVLALVHWIYSMTATEGSFKSIFEYLASVTRSILLIEWIDPCDPGVLDLHHTSRNKQFQVEPYELDRFLEAGRRYFGRVESVIEITKTRQLYILRKEVLAHGHSATVRIGEVVVRKDYHPHILKSHIGIPVREKEALTQLKGNRNFPFIFHEDSKGFEMSYCGAPLSRENMPSDVNSQASQIIADLRAANMRHNDIHRGNLHVLKGKLYLIDFGWASKGLDLPDFLPSNIGIDMGAREIGDREDDEEMIFRSIEFVERER
jgi:hypothetical protein